ncbi:hypothetical protein BDU57DRAFT_204897 [Ampelomyces quisqualis]|uniref:NodB homology domain-containing protein n=1 Tax=Ampelomyces quisqualis TaxID=50730 RepID=A0A6A5QJG9_AMPQU|nr:hypothetical protein BDU57DRAFT_204897 [Ampelomyces quisqualis]
MLLSPPLAHSNRPKYSVILRDHLYHIHILQPAADSLTRMQPLSLIDTVSLFQFSTVVSAHLSQHMIEEVHGLTASHIQRRDWGTPDVDSKKQFGPGIGFCAPGDCCSPVGFCGRGYQHCSSPNCQIDYSNGCDASKKPLGEPTLNVSRSLLGNVTYDGPGIESCTKPGTIALTFDDGPFNYTSHLLDVLASYGAKATFFITGNNLGKGQIDIEATGWPNIIRRMHAEGHQIAGHSWRHANMSSLNETAMANQVQYLEMAFRNILGFFPTYFRPPYTDCSDACQRLLKKMGYHITYQNFVSNDWKSDDSNKIVDAKEYFVRTMQQVNPRESKHILLMHDTHYQTGWNLTNYMLDYFQLKNLSRSVTVGECLGDPPENWYRVASGAPNRSLLLRKSKSSTLQHNAILQYSILLLIFAQYVAIIYI